jgi:hypothetical protein
MTYDRQCFLIVIHGCHAIIPSYCFAYRARSMPICMFFSLKLLKKTSLRDQPNAGSENAKSSCIKQKKVNLLLGQGYRTPRGTMIDEYGTEVISSGKRKKSEKNLLQCHFVHLESHLKLPSFIPILCGDKSPSRCLNSSTIFKITTAIKFGIGGVSFNEPVLPYFT